MSQRSEELRKQARDITRNIFAQDDRQTRELSLGLAQACIALARNEEWLEGEIPPMEGHGHLKKTEALSPSSEIPSRSCSRRFAAT